MLDFNFECPVKIIFGNDCRLTLHTAIRGRYARALLVCSQGPFRTNGLYAEIKWELEKAGLTVFNMSDIDSNPRISSVYEGVRICKKNHIDLVVALGGGSTLDCSKVIAAAALSEHDAQDFLWGCCGTKRRFESSLDTILIPTMASTGTELNNTAVIMNPETTSKTYCEADCLFSTYTIIDPVIAKSVPIRLTTWATMDILSHTFEYYFNGNQSSVFQMRFSEALIMSTMECLEALVANPEDTTARGELAWTSVMAWGGLTKIGRGAPDMSCHTFGEGLVPYFDIHHGATMGVATSRWMRFVYQKHPGLFARFARNVLGVIDADDQSAAETGFNKYMDWLRKVNAPDTLVELTGHPIDESLLRQIAARVIKENGTVGTLEPLSEDDIFQIYKDMCVPYLHKGEQA